MTFYYLEDENVLEGNHGEHYAEIDEHGNLRIDVGHIMEEGRAERKLCEMMNQIKAAIEANGYAVEFNGSHFVATEGEDEE